MNPDESKPQFSEIEIREAVGVSGDDLLFVPQNPGQYFQYVNGKLTFIGTKEDARKFAVLRV